MTSWGISSVGRAVASHATGQEFESPMLHHFPNNRKRFKQNACGCLFYEVQRGATANGGNIIWAQHRFLRFGKKFIEEYRSSCHRQQTHHPKNRRCGNMLSIPFRAIIPPPCCAARPLSKEKGEPQTRLAFFSGLMCVRHAYRIAATAAFSSRSSFTDASIFSRENASIGSP